MTLTSKNSCLPALLLPVPVNLFLDFLVFFFVFLKQLFTQRVGRDFRPRLEKETFGLFWALLGQEYHYHLMNEFPPGNSFFS